jgi:hypothetical protein
MSTTEEFPPLIDEENVPTEGSGDPATEIPPPQREGGPEQNP